VVRTIERKKVSKGGGVKSNYMTETMYRGGGGGNLSKQLLHARGREAGEKGKEVKERAEKMKRRRFRLVARGEGSGKGIVFLQPVGYRKTNSSHSLGEEKNLRIESRKGGAGALHF